MGFPQDKTLCYAQRNSEEAHISTTLNPVESEEAVLCSAYTQGDLRSYLPDHITVNGKLYLLEIPKTIDQGFFIGYRQKDADQLLYRADGNSADSYAKLIMRLVDDGKIPSPKLETIRS